MGTAPTYYVWSQIKEASHTDIVSLFSQAQLASHFKFAELTAGLLPEEDVSQIRVQRRVASTFQRLQIGRADFVLHNMDGGYSPKITTSVLPRKRILTKAITDAGSIYGLFSGYIEDISIHPDLSRRTAHIQAGDVARNFKRLVNIPLQVEVNVTSLFNLVIDGAGIATKSIGSMVDVPTWALMDNSPAGEIFHQLIESGGHHAYISPQDGIVVRDRNFGFGLSAVASYDNSFLALTYKEGAASIRNDVTIAGQQRKTSVSIGTVAWIENAITVASGDNVTANLEFLDPDTTERPTPVASLVALVSSTDYRVNDTVDGTGSDITSFYTVTASAFATTADIHVTGTYSGTGYLTHMQLRGYPIQRKPEFAARTEDASSQLLFERQSLKITNDFIPAFNNAKTYSQFLVSIWKDPVPDVGFTIKNQFPDVVQRELMQVVSVVESNTGLNGDFLINNISHDINMVKGTAHSVTFGVEQHNTAGYFILDKEVEGKLDTGRKLGF